MGIPAKQLYEFGPFRLDVRKRLVLRDDRPVAITPKLFETLLALVENSGRVVEKEYLLARLWPDTVVEESNLAVNVSALRKALGESAADHLYIVTVPGRGYQFVAEVRQVGEEEPTLTLEKYTTAEIIIEQEEDDSSPDYLPAADVGRRLLEPPSAAKSRAYLKAGAVIFAALLIGVVGYLLISGKLLPKRPPAAPESIAVLPFRLMGGPEGEEYLGLGMADALITRMGNVKQIKIRPTSAVMKYDRADQDPVAAGRELNVEAVLEGSIRRSGDRVRMTVQLVSVETGTPLWADTFDEKVSDVFTVEDRLSQKVVDSLTLNLSGEEKTRLAKRHTENAEAYAAYLRGRFYRNKQTPEGMRKALEYFTQAVEIDPRFALAYSGLADAYAYMGFRIYALQPPRETMPKAQAAAMKSLEMDDTLAEAHASLGFVKLRYEWNWEAAERELKRAVELKPNYSSAHHWYADLLFVTGREEEAAARLKLAREADPTSYLVNSSTLQSHLYFLRQYDQAIEVCRRVVEIEPNHYVAHLGLGSAYERKGMYEEAISELRKVIEVAPGKSGESLLGYTYAAMGRREEALKIIERYKEASKTSYVPALYIAVIYSGLREADLTMEWLEKGYEERSTAMIYLNHESRYDWLRSDPRFQNLLKRIGFRS